MTTTETATLAQQQAAGLRALADMIENNPDLAPSAAYLSRLDVFYAWTQDAIAAIIRAGLAAGATVDKDYGNNHFVATLRFGPVGVSVLTARETVCTKVVDTHEVTEEVPDPDALAKALASVPTVTVTRMVEDVTWDCKPVMAVEAVSQ